MDTVYKKGIPAARKTLEEIKDKFSGLDTGTDWKKLRIEPLLDHARSLERLLRSPEFSRETSRLPRGVVMFHSDLIYFRENINTLKAILESERKVFSRRTGASAGRRVRRSPKRKQE